MLRRAAATSLCAVLSLSAACGFVEDQRGSASDLSTSTSQPALRADAEDPAPGPTSTISPAPQTPDAPTGRPNADPGPPATNPVPPGTDEPVPVPATPPTPWIPAVVDPEADVCVAVSQTMNVGFSVFGLAQPPPEFRREGAGRFNLAMTYLLPFLPSDQAGPESPLRASLAAATEIIETGGPERQVWELMLSTYQQYGSLIDSLVDPLIDTCPDVARWYPKNASTVVIEQLRGILATT